MKKQKGFTLIELLVVITIMITMMATVLIMMQSDRDRQIMRVNADKFTSTIREAQNSALSGKQIGGESPCNFTIDTSDNDYSAVAITFEAGEPNAGCGSEQDNRSQDLVPASPYDGGVVKFSGPRILTFSGQFADITAGILNDERAAKYVFRKGTLDYTVCVYRSGRVESRGFGSDLNCN